MDYSNVYSYLLCSRHIFLGFTKCGRYVLSYTSDCGEDDDFSFYIYHLYWWEFNLHSRLKQVKERNIYLLPGNCHIQSSVFTIKYFFAIQCPLAVSTSNIYVQLFCTTFLRSLGPPCATICRRGNLQWPLPDCVWVAKWPHQNCHLWLQVRGDE